MRYPKAWPYMDKESRQAWMKTFGKKQQAVEEKYKKSYRDYVDEMRNDKERKSDIPF